MGQIFASHAQCDTGAQRRAAALAAEVRTVRDELAGANARINTLSADVVRINAASEASRKRLQGLLDEARADHATAARQLVECRRAAAETESQLVECRAKAAETNAKMAKMLKAMRSIDDISDTDMEALMMASAAAIGAFAYSQSGDDDDEQQTELHQVARNYQQRQTTSAAPTTIVNPVPEPDRRFYPPTEMPIVSERDSVKDEMLSLFTGSNTTGNEHRSRETVAQSSFTGGGVATTTHGQPLTIEEKVQYYNDSLTGRQNNVKPVASQMVGPGVNTQPGVASTGGFHQYFRVMPNNAEGAKRDTELAGGIRSGAATVKRSAATAGELTVNGQLKLVNNCQEMLPVRAGVNGKLQQPCVVLRCPRKVTPTCDATWGVAGSAVTGRCVGDTGQWTSRRKVEQEHCVVMNLQGGATRQAQQAAPAVTATQRGEQCTGYMGALQAGYTAGTVPCGYRFEPTNRSVLNRQDTGPAFGVVTRQTTDSGATNRVPMTNRALASTCVTGIAGRTGVTNAINKNPQYRAPPTNRSVLNGSRMGGAGAAGSGAAAMQYGSVLGTPMTSNKEHMTGHMAAGGRMNVTQGVAQVMANAQCADRVNPGAAQVQAGRQNAAPRAGGGGVVNQCGNKLPERNGRGNIDPPCNALMVTRTV